MTPEHTPAHGTATAPSAAAHGSDSRAARRAAARRDLRTERSARADLAAHSVQRLFLHRVMNVPGTLIGSPSAPAPTGMKQRIAGWNYWWQAHLLDAVVDAGNRALDRDEPSEAAARLKQGRQLLRGIRAHNFGIWQNAFYDDMAWLTLAAGRFNSLAARVGGNADLARSAGRALYPQLEQAVTEDLGGGAFWSKSEDYKNVPASAPIALAFSRRGRDAEAAGLRRWMREKLFDPSRGYLDGIHLYRERNASLRTELDAKLFSYNQGTALAATLAAEQPDLEHAEEIIRLVSEHMTETVHVEGIDVRVLRTAGSGDSGLFAGILARYLAEAAQDQRLSATARETAADLVVATAEMLWNGRREYDPDLPLGEPGVDVNEIRGQAVALFSPDVTRIAVDSLGAGSRPQLSSQVMAWTFLEAAWRLA